MILLKEEVRVRCLLRRVPRAHLHHTAHHHTQPGAVQLCKLRAELINWCVCAASLIQMIIFQWDITLLCEKSPASSELLQWSLAEPSVPQHVLRQAGSETARPCHTSCLLQSLTSSAGVCDIHPVEKANIPELLEYIFLVFQDLILSK